MTMIKINPEQLYQIAQQVDLGRQQLEQMNRQLYGHLVSMQSLWMGMTQERFFQDYEHSRPVLERALEHMARMAMELRTIATRFSEADAEQGGYQAAIGGAVGLDVHGAAPTDAGPGYRMAYNSFLGKWLPVNEQGVTDQAALQAYERDKGHLDVNAMQADVHSEPLGEDLMTLQIKAFQEGIHPFTGERVSDNYAAMMVTTLKLSQVFMGIQAIRGSMPGRKGPYRLPSNHPVVQKIQKNMEAVRAEKSMQSGLGSGAMGKANQSYLSPDMEQKILGGERIPGKNGIRGGHSPNVINDSNPNYAVEVLRENSDGTKFVQFYHQFPDGTLAKLKKSTVFPDSWKDETIISSIKKISDTPAVGSRTSDGGTTTTLHSGTVDGVQIDVIKEGNSITAGYPVGGKPTPGFEPIN